MRHVKTLTGNGRLLLSGANPVPVSYALPVYERQGIKEARGSLRSDPGTLWALHQARRADLELESGDHLAVTIRYWNGAIDAQVDIEVLGALPDD